ncbi:MAG: alpha/beta hydrolase [Kofleriaceae bacterium]
MGVLGHELVGAGAVRVVVLNDWLCDTSTWDSARAYLDRERFRYAFVDLRGYGRSRGRAGVFTVSEAANDVIEVVDALGWERCAVVGHSMSTLVALHLGQHHADRVERIAVVTPAPIGGFGADAAAIERTRELADSGDAGRTAYLLERFAARLSPGWARFKAARWCATSDPAAVAGYFATFARDGLPTPTTPIDVPVLAITGELDAPPMRRAAVEPMLAAVCTRLEVASIAESGHYPMQETPPLTVALLERFFAP